MLCPEDRVKIPSSDLSSMYYFAVIPLWLSINFYHVPKLAIMPPSFGDRLHPGVSSTILQPGLDPRVQATSTMAWPQNSTCYLGGPSLIGGPITSNLHTEDRRELQVVSLTLEYSFSEAAKAHNSMLIPLGASPEALGPFFLIRPHGITSATAVNSLPSLSHLSHWQAHKSHTLGWKLSGFAYARCLFVSTLALALLVSVWVWVCV